ncbi:MAG: thiamine diphosphokinase [Spirochaetales bacterium]|nr:thiamine diphosphokinase [Spirochaetales bacterium]
MKGILFIGGAAPEYNFIKKEIDEAELIIAADSGFDSAISMDVKPDIILGDMDSIKNIKKLNSYPEDKVFIFSKEKDETDTELGIKYLKDHNFNEIVIIGGGGGRMDHFLAIVLLFDREFSPDIWYTHNTRFQKITGSCKVYSGKGQLVSFFPTGKGICRMKSKGLKWPLDDLIWSRGDMGISNITTDDPFFIEMIEGRLMMVNQLKDLEY